MLGAYDPEPDYFFHWYRDAAVVAEAMRELFEDTGELLPDGQSIAARRAELLSACAHRKA